MSNVISGSCPSSPLQNASMSRSSVLSAGVAFPLCGAGVSFLVWLWMLSSNASVETLCGASLVVASLLLLAVCLLLRRNKQFGSVDGDVIFHRGVFVLIAGCAIIVKFVGDTDADHLLGGHSHGWFSLAMPAVMAFIALINKGQQQSGRAGFFGRTSQLLSGFDYISGLYPVLCGLFGLAAFRNAVEVLRFSLGDLPWSAAHVQAALSLYRLMGSRTFYVSFCVAPALWLVKAGWETVHNKYNTNTPTRPLLSRVTVMCLWLIGMAWIACYFSYDAARWYYGNPAHGTVIDRNILASSETLSACTESAASNAAQTACYQAAAIRWQCQIHEVDLAIWPRLNANGKMQFLHDEAHWNNMESGYLSALAKHAPRTPSGQLALARQRLRGLETRLDYLCAQADEQNLMKSDRRFLPDL